MNDVKSNYVAMLFDGEADPDLIERSTRFRKSLFVDLLGWNLAAGADTERDEFDRADTMHALLLRDEEPVACFRAIRCDRPYLSECIFPSLASVAAYPKRRASWEISRFGVWPLADPRERFMAAKLNYGLMLRFASMHNAVSLVAVADLTYERFLVSIGLRSRRFGPPKPVCTDARGQPLTLVAGEIPLADQSGAKFTSLRALAESLEIYDATHVCGRSAVPA